MIQSDKQDLFGSQENQGVNYEKFRPKYPIQFIQNIITNAKNKNNYLDLACGTGQLLYQIAPAFKNNILGVDLSEKQIQVAQKLLDNLQKSEQNNQEYAKNIKLHALDCEKLDENLQKIYQQEIKFDVITIGQALHWFDVENILNQIKNKLLQEGGSLYVLGYFALGFHYNYEDKNFNLEGQKHYDQYYKIVEPYFDCDRKELSQGYPNYPFQKYFKNVEKIEQIDYIQCSLFEFYKYCRTYSAYNTYLQKFSQDTGFQDPSDILLVNAQEELNEYLTKNNISKKQNEVVMRNYQFFWKLSN